MSSGSFIRMSVGELTLDPITKTPIVILRDSDNKINLPILIGLPGGDIDGHRDRGDSDASSHDP